MSLRFGPGLAICVLTGGMLAGAQSTAHTAASDSTPKQKLALRFQSAVAAYQAGKLTDASTLLEAMLPQASKCTPLGNAPGCFHLLREAGVTFTLHSRDERQ